MKALVISDSHGEDLRWFVGECLKKHGPFDAVLHCGDGAGDLPDAERACLDRNPGCCLMAVRGNCDFFRDEPLVRMEEMGGVKVMMTHGHLHHVKTSLLLLDNAAADNGCRIALYGHTHKANVEYRKTILLNPGSAADGRYAVLSCSNGEIKFDLYSL